MNQIYFEAKYGVAHLKGYVYEEEINDDEPLYFLTEEGFETPRMQIYCDIPFDADEETKFKAEQDANALEEAWTTDHMFLQFLADFANENRTFERPNYKLIINDGDVK